MQTPDFNDIAEAQLDAIRDILISKRAEYAGDEDVLRNFKLGALLNRDTPMETLLGYLTKHLISVYDMAKSDKPSPVEKWDEKITDSITYLVLLKALAIEEMYEDEPIDLLRNSVAMSPPCSCETCVPTPSDATRRSHP